ncbi:type II toxin-antitoxin system VapC family toxin [Endozoicomonas sp. ONNA2]|uniref:type II toxin-antitoxin system VapC family toxin n=1 Tax=Endozoicomonas sp. ONNA2 TaxID=2828741 RepID=UPI002148638E|nr:type II toxin-antitoxin system VapC family toxin [Endozoicomonas sp. ONNA2]
MDNPSAVLHQAIQATERAEALITSVTSSERLWFKALEPYAKHPAYDALFVVLAETFDCPLVTRDKKLLCNFPDIATTPERLLKP